MCYFAQFEETVSISFYNSGFGRRNLLLRHGQKALSYQIIAYARQFTGVPLGNGYPYGYYVFHIFESIVNNTGLYNTDYLLSD